MFGSGQVQGVCRTALIADVGIQVTTADVTSAMNQTIRQQKAVIDKKFGAAWTAGHPHHQGHRGTRYSGRSRPEPPPLAVMGERDIEVKIRDRRRVAAAGLVVSTGGGRPLGSARSATRLATTAAGEDARARTRRQEPCGPIRTTVEGCG